MKRKNGRFICNENEIEVWIPEGDYARLVNEDKGYKFEFYDFDVDANEEQKEMNHFLEGNSEEEYKRKFPECIKAKLTIPMLGHSNINENEFLIRARNIQEMVEKGKTEKLTEYLTSWHKELFEK